MATITSITAQKKDGRANIYLDGRFFCGLETITVLSCGLAVGKEVSEQEIEQLQRKSELQVAFDKCVAKLAVRQRSKKELADFLKQKGFLQGVVNDCLSKLGEYGYVDDLSFAQALVQSYPGLGKKRLEQKLFQKGVSSDIVSEVLLETSDGDQLAAAKSAAQKFLRSKKDAKNLREKLFRHLQYKGFSFEIAQKVADCANAEEDA